MTAGEVLTTLSRCDIRLCGRPPVVKLYTLAGERIDLCQDHYDGIAGVVDPDSAARIARDKR